MLIFTYIKNYRHLSVDEKEIAVIDNICIKIAEQYIRKRNNILIILNYGRASKRCILDKYDIRYNDDIIFNKYDIKYNGVFCTI